LSVVTVCNFAERNMDGSVSVCAGPFLPSLSSVVFPFSCWFCYLFVLLFSLCPLSFANHSVFLCLVFFYLFSPFLSFPPPRAPGDAPSMDHRGIRPPPRGHQQLYRCLSHPLMKRSGAAAIPPYWRESDPAGAIQRLVDPRSSRRRRIGDLQTHEATSLVCPHRDCLQRYHRHSPTSDWRSGPASRVGTGDQRAFAQE